MKEARGKRIVLILVMALIAVLSWSIAWADFYVVGLGKRAKKTILVSPKSTETASGTALLNAVNGITDAGVTNPYLVIIEPGIYDIEDNSLQMKEYVDIQGSGENVTKITGTKDSTSSGVLVGADNAEVRFLTVENTAGGEFAWGNAIYNSSASPKITNMTAIASGGKHNFGVHNNNSSSPTMTNVTASASGGSGTNTGVRNINSSSPKLKNVTAIASGGSGVNYGVDNSFSSNATIEHSVLSGNVAALTNDASGATIYIGNTRLDGGVGGTGPTICAGVYDGDFAFYADTCP